MSDLVERDAVLDGLKGCMCEDWVKTLFATMVKQLPSVTQKSGKWERHYTRPNVYKDLLWYCSACGDGCRYNDAFMFDYCPNCGARMVEPQETKTWNGIHAQITAPKGTFERIFNEVDDDNDI